MGELGAVRRYHYWSDRGIAQVAADNDIALTSRTRWALRAPNLPFIAQFELGEERRDLRRHELARRIETAIGLNAVEDFVTPPPASFAKGTGRVEYARTTVKYAANEGAVFHTMAKASNGAAVHVCLFGSMDNFPHWLRSAPAPKGGWTSSAWHAIEELLTSRGSVNTSQWDDDQAISYEALNLALHQGEVRHTEEHTGKPWTRGWTIGGADGVEWFAEIFKDVGLDKDRWNLDDEVPIDRILVGAPLWMRSPDPRPIQLYHAEGSKVILRSGRQDTFPASSRFYRDDD